MRIPTEILNKVKPALLENKDVLHCKFIQSNGWINMVTTTENGNKQNYVIGCYDNEIKACKLTRSLNRVYKF